MGQDVNAALIIIGNEILSGRTQDVNVQYIATGLNDVGVRLREVRVVADDPDAIIAAVNALRAANDYVFTTGGIGPTHDDITSECVARAFGVPLLRDPRAVERLARLIKPENLNEARLRMANIPQGADLIDNPVSAAPGFILGNVYVMAGVPRIMQAMWAELGPTLKGGQPIISRAVHALRVSEGLIADGLSAIQARYPALDLGSYPYYRPTGNGVSIVAKGTDAASAEAAIAEVTALMLTLGVDPVQGEPAA